MFYNNIGATAGGSILSGSNTANLALFTNIQSGRPDRPHRTLSHQHRGMLADGPAGNSGQ
jgi:hypothetical protein